MDYYSSPETPLVFRKRRRAGIVLMLLPFLLTSSLSLLFALGGLWLDGGVNGPLPIPSVPELCVQVLFGPYMVLTLPIIFGGLWIYDRPLTVCSALYCVLVGCIYFSIALFSLYITLGYFLQK